MTLPVDSGDAGAALVVTALVPGRSDPSHRAERVTEWVCGEALELAERRDEWARATGPDGYEAWVPLGSLKLVSGPEAASWRAAATLWSLGTELVAEGPRGAGSGADAPGSGSDAPGSEWGGSHVVSGPSAPNWLPWGGRVGPAPAGTVRLPDGSTTRPRDPGRLVQEPDRARRFPRDGRALVETAARWLGAPYAWGGRTEAGVDCSGLVQAVYALHGVPLPRDSGAQAAADPPIDGVEPDRLDPGDLLFFAPEGRGITHAAIAAGGTRVLHAAASRGRVAWEDLASDAPLARRLHASIVRVTRPLGRSPASPS